MPTHAMSNGMEGVGMEPRHPIVELIGPQHFQWLSKEFNEETTLRDLPEEILQRAASVDIAKRDYSTDRAGITAIAVITFAYRLAGKVQRPQFGPKDILLLKVLAKAEARRRKGRFAGKHPLWNAPLFELITGEVGERIRAMPTLNSAT